MAHGKKIIPSGDAAFDAFFKNICQYVNTMCTGTPPKWTHIPVTARTALNDAYADWYTAYAPTLKPHTPGETAAKNTAKKTATKVLEHFIQVWIRGFPEIVTEADLINMGIPPLDSTHSPIGRPATKPVFAIEVKAIRQLVIRFRDEGSTSNARPYGMNGAVISWGIFSAPPPDPEALARTKLATRTPYILRFTEEDRGKTVYIALQWQNESGVRGDFTAIESAIIP
jgi:hypothetical protein